MCNRSRPFLGRLSGHSKSQLRYPSSVAADPKITRRWFATLGGNNDMLFFLLF